MVTDKSKLIRSKYSIKLKKKTTCCHLENDSLCPSTLRSQKTELATNKMKTVKQNLLKHIFRKSPPFPLNFHANNSQINQAISFPNPDLSQSSSYTYITFNCIGWSDGISLHDSLCPSSTALPWAWKTSLLRSSEKNHYELPQRTTDILV